MSKLFSNTKDASFAAQAAAVVALVVGVVVFAVGVVGAALVWDAIWSAWALSEVWNTYLRTVPEFAFLPVLSKLGAFSLASVWTALSTYRMTSSDSDSENNNGCGKLAVAFLVSPLRAMIIVGLLGLLFQWFPLVAK